MNSFSPPTSIFLGLLNNLESWKIVVLGNNKTNDKYWKALNNSNKLVYLSNNDQNNLGYSSIKYIDNFSYFRKNIGYLYAIQHGATEIYEIEEDIIIEDTNDLDFKLNNNLINYCIRNDSMFINPYINFGDKNIWPRGFRINDLGKDFNNNFSILNSSQLIIKPLIYQGLINGFPDIDTIFFQTMIKTNQIFNYNLSKNYPLLYFPGYYTPINSMNTKYLYEMFPFLLLPTTVNKELSDIYRGYIMQRFAWGLNGTVIYHYSSFYRKNFGNLFHNKFINGKDIYHNLDNFLTILEMKDYPKINDYIKLLIHLINNLISNKFLKENDLYLYKAFIKDLNNLGYNFTYNFSKEINFNYKDFLKIFSEFNLYFPSKQKIVMENNNKNSIKLLNHYYSKKIYNDILLIINYNHIGLEKLNNYIFKLYIKNFPNIAFILPNYTNLINNTNIIVCNESYYGHFSYICLKKVYLNYPNMKGYLFINDDDFMKYWELENLDTNIPWIYPFNPITIEWSHYNNCLPIKYILNNNIEWKNNLTKFLGYNGISMAISDFYYLPNYLFPKFLNIIEIMYKSKLFLECAVPNSMGIILAPKYQYIYFNGLWKNKRKEVIKYLRSSYKEITIHPIKFSNLDFQHEANKFIYFTNAEEY